MVKMRPQMYMDEQIPAVTNFIHGFLAACHSFDIDFYQDYERAFRQVSIQRGWKFVSSPLWEQMSDVGLSSEQICEEMLTIYVEVWNKIADDTQRQD